MNLSRYLFLNFTPSLVLLLILAACASDEMSLSSPDESIDVRVVMREGKLTYSVTKNDTTVLEPSQLGLTLTTESFSSDLKLLGVSDVETVSEKYSMFQGKRSENSYQANKRIFHLQNINGHELDVIFQVSNDGVAFQYFFPEADDSIKTIAGETSSFNFSNSATAFLQPMQDAKTGWSKVNPCYEEYYQKEIPVGTPSPTKSGWVYPALFHMNNHWVLITESSLDNTFCGSRLKQTLPDGEYSVGYPDSLEAFPGGGVLPQSSLPWRTPWRVIVIGSLKTIVESNLPVSLSAPPAEIDTSYIRPGHSSWSWALLKDDSTVFSVQKKFVDYASAMQWDYCLVDADWDRKIGYDKISEFAAYAKSQNVGLLLWYNSAGDWNETPQTPKDKMLTRDVRKKEFSFLADAGVKGVKIDFFGGDGRSMINYYLDILKDAAEYKLLVNFHGSTIPRGWHRTYPNLMSMEAVRGFEFVTFEQVNADEQPSHCTILPFTRNAFDPMDFTVSSLDSVPGIQRKTSPSFELALSVVFLSGIQHFVEKPSGMKNVSDSVKEFLRDLPRQWDDSKFISGYPGKEIVIARKAGNTWYIAGINGESVVKTLNVDLRFMQAKNASMFFDAQGAEKFGMRALDLTNPVTEVKLEPHGGFIIVADVKL